MKFIHMADLHLGKPFIEIPPDQAKQRCLNRWDTLRRVIEMIKQEQIELLLIAGDLLEYEYSTLDMCQKLNHLFSLVPDTHIIIAPGNHDACYKDSYYRTYEWSSNVFIFTREAIVPHIVPELDLTVWGFGWNHKEINHDILSDWEQDEVETNYHILLIHGDALHQHTKYLPLDINKLLKMNFNYLALGHIHQRYTLEHASYPGSMEPLKWEESGCHGVIKGQLTPPGKLQTEFYPVAQVKYIRDEIIVKNPDTAESLSAKLLHKYQDQSNNFYHLTFTGTHEDSHALLEAVKKMVAPTFRHIELIDQINAFYEEHWDIDSVEGRALTKYFEKLEPLRQEMSLSDWHALRRIGYEGLFKKRIDKYENM